MPTLNPSKIRAYAHRRLALAALHANSSLSVRLARYTHHIEIARGLESQAPAPACRLGLASFLKLTQGRQSQACGAAAQGDAV